MVGEMLNNAVEIFQQFISLPNGFDIPLLNQYNAVVKIFRGGFTCARRLLQKMQNTCTIRSRLRLAHCPVSI